MAHVSRTPSRIPPAAPHGRVIGENLPQICGATPSDFHTVETRGLREIDAKVRIISAALDRCNPPVTTISAPSGHVRNGTKIDEKKSASTVQAGTSRLPRPHGSATSNASLEENASFRTQTYRPGDDRDGHDPAAAAGRAQVAQGSCTCLADIDAKLKESGVMLNATLGIGGPARPLINLVRIDNWKPEMRRGKPRVFMPTYCPFCGVKYETRPGAREDV